MARLQPALPTRAGATVQPEVAGSLLHGGKNDGKQVTWTHDLRQMLQTKQDTGLVKPLRRVRVSPPVPPGLGSEGTDSSC